jgi:hypothetical protein
VRQRETRSSRLHPFIKDSFISSIQESQYFSDSEHQMVSNWAQYKDAHENMKRPPSKVGYFTKIEEIFCTALTAQSAQKRDQIHLSFYSTWDI